MRHVAVLVSVVTRVGDEGFRKHPIGLGPLRLAVTCS